jgi:hypothetical protein
MMGLKLGGGGFTTRSFVLYEKKKEKKKKAFSRNIRGTRRETRMVSKNLKDLIKRDNMILPIMKLMCRIDCDFEQK